MSLVYFYMENEKHWRLQETVNLPPQVYGVRIPDSPPSFRSVRIEVITADCLSAYGGSIPPQTAKLLGNSVMVTPQTLTLLF